MSKSTRSLAQDTERFLTALLGEANSANEPDGQRGSDGREMWSIADRLKLAATITSFISAKHRIDAESGEDESEFADLKQQLTNTGRRRAANG